MTKTFFAVFFAAAVLSGCTVCTDCEPEYQADSSPTTIYRYTTYPGRQQSVSSRMQQPMSPAFNYLSRPTAYFPPPAQPRTPAYQPAPFANFSGAPRPFFNGYSPAYSTSYGSNYSGNGYSGTAFQTSPTPILDFNSMPGPTAYSPIAQPRIPFYQPSSPWGNQPVSNNSYPAYSNSYYSSGYSNAPPVFSPASGNFMPLNRMSYPASPYPSYQPQAQLPVFQTAPQPMWWQR